MRDFLEILLDVINVLGMVFFLLIEVVCSWWFFNIGLWLGGISMAIVFPVTIALGIYWSGKRG